MFDEESRSRAGPDAGGGRQRRRLAAELGLLQDMPAIDVENAWGLNATSYGNHEFDYGVQRLLQHQERANFPFLATNIVEAATGTARLGDAVEGLHRQRHPGRRDRRRAREHAGARLGRGDRRADVPRRGPAHQGGVGTARRKGVKVQVVVIHQGTNTGRTDRQLRGVPWEGPILDIADPLQDTTVDAMIVGHTHRISNLMRGNILITEGINAGASYSVCSCRQGRRRRLGRRRHARRQEPRCGGTGRRQGDRGAANAADRGAPQPGDRHAANDILRAPTRLHESAMGNMVADAMRGSTQAWTPRRRTRAGLRQTSLSAAECQRAARRDHLGRDVRRPAVRQPDDDPHADRRPARRRS